MLSCNKCSMAPSKASVGKSSPYMRWTCCKKKQHGLLLWVNRTGFFSQICYVFTNFLQLRTKLFQKTFVRYERKRKCFIYYYDPGKQRANSNQRKSADSEDSAYIVVICKLISILVDRTGHETFFLETDWTEVYTLGDCVKIPSLSLPTI